MKHIAAISLVLALQPTICSASDTLALPPAPQTTASAIPTPSPTATASPLPAATIPLAAPSSPAVVQPSPAAAPPTPATSAPSPVVASPSPYSYSYQPPVPPQNEPRIFEIDLTDRVVRAGLMQLRVLADPSVISIVVRSMGHEFAVPQLGSGVFMASNHVPNIPFFLKGRTLWVDFVASRQDGRQTVVSLPVVLN